ncbi:hypothetical protein [Tsukamurella paurometabola]|uniref:Uncharacterized protein n=1 Tax=Tsukamurella paurometabola TaxID=2061 RepID=A0ABS5NDS9_TSUPA|nr:hypothetical protein [Tsukamurella paurometabola]MBS4102419.1 hypothetical protein [Tsukamurella paurometabola]
MTEMLDEFIGRELTTRFESFTVRPSGDPKSEFEACRHIHSGGYVNERDRSVGEIWSWNAKPAATALIMQIERYHKTPNVVVPRVPAGVQVGGQGEFVQWCIDYDPHDGFDRFHLNVYTH